jgi:hypothetical protein
MRPEEWRDIKGYEGVYQVSSFGRIKSLARDLPRKKCGIKKLKTRILRTAIKGGYDSFILCKDGKHHKTRVHKEVALAFGISGTGVIDHYDHNLRNNRVDNLRRVSNGDNLLNTAQVPNGNNPARGISFTPNKKKPYRVITGRDGYLGYFKTLSEAKRARARSLKLRNSKPHPSLFES